MKALRSLSIAAAAVLTAGGSPAAEPREVIIPGTTAPVLSLVEDLPWTFSVESMEAVTEEDADQLGEPIDGQQLIVGSATPIRETATGRLYLRLELTCLRFPESSDAHSALADAVIGADPDTGLSYAWDALLTSGTWLYHLHAPCTLAEAHFDAAVASLRAAISVTGESSRWVRCRCGGGCAFVPD